MSLAAFKKLKDNEEWRSRYSQLYSGSVLLESDLCGGAANVSTDDCWGGISFLTNADTQYTSLLARNRLQKMQRVLEVESETEETPAAKEDKEMTTLPALEADSSLLQLLRSRRQSLLSVRMQAKKEQDVVVAGERDSTRLRSERAGSVSVRLWDLERSVSRSRTSTRRYDAFNSFVLPATNTFPDVMNRSPDETKDASPTSSPPRWSIRRSLCVACSQKWKDRSSIEKVRYSGLKRKTLSYTPVSVPARLQSSIMSQYNPKPLPTLDIERVSLSNRKSSFGSSWQLCRARRPRLLSYSKRYVRGSSVDTVQQIPISDPPRLNLELEQKVQSFLTDKKKQFIEY